jgi:hypothetical protein
MIYNDSICYKSVWEMGYNGRGVRIGIVVDKANGKNSGELFLYIYYIINVSFTYRH